MADVECWRADGIAWRQNDAMDAKRRHVLVIGRPGDRALVQRMWDGCAGAPFDWIGLGPWLDRETDHEPFLWDSAAFRWALDSVMESYQHAAVAVIGDGALPVLVNAPVLRVNPLDEDSAIESLRYMIERSPPPNAGPRWVREPAEWVNLSFGDPASGGNRLLLVGDSISNGYGNIVRAHMAKMRTVDQLQTSEGVKGPMLKDQVDFMLGARDYDDIHMNIGLHMHDVPPVEYGECLGALLDHIRSKSSARITFAATTPVSLDADLARLDEARTDEVRALNNAARASCEARGVQWNDLFQLCLDEGLCKIDRVHFTPSANMRIADAVLAAIG